MDETSVTQADHVIGIFGGLSKTAQALGHRNCSTVQGWKERGFIPAQQQPKVLEAGQLLGLPIGPEDFFPPYIGEEAA